MSTDFSIKPAGAPVAAPIVQPIREAAKQAVQTELPASATVTAADAGPATRAIVPRTSMRMLDLRT